MLAGGQRVLADEAPAAYYVEPALVGVESARVAGDGFAFALGPPDLRGSGKEREDVAGMALAQEKLDWTPKVGLEDGLKETIAYFKHLLST